MAIQFDLPDSSIGIPIPAAYIRIATVAVYRTRDPDNRFRVAIDAVPYASIPAHEDVQGVGFIREHVPLPELEACDGDTLLAKAYSWLMTKPEFVGAVVV